MASIAIRESTLTSSSVTIRISSLSSSWNSSNYNSAGVTTATFSPSSWPNGASSLGGTKYYADDPPSSGSNKYVDIEITGLESGTEYTYWGFTQAANGTYFAIGEVSFTTLEIYTLTVNFKDTKNKETFETTTYEVDENTEITPYDYAENLTSDGYTYSHSSDNITMTEDKTVTLYYERHLDATFTLSDSNISTTSVTFTITLPQTFSGTYYDGLMLYNSNDDEILSWSAGKSLSVTLTGLTPGATYSLYCRVILANGNYYHIGSKNGKKANATVITFTLLDISDEDLIKGCTARWYNYAAGNTGTWSSSKPSFLIDMGDYSYSSKFFIQAGVCETEDYDFTVPNTNEPSPIRAQNTSPTANGSDTIVMTCTSPIDPCTLKQYTAFVQTINGTYMPIPAVAPISEDNEYEFYGATKPDDVLYTEGYEPATSEEVKLKATDIVSFIRVMNFVNLWFKDDYNAGIDYTIVKEGLPIKAITYGGDDETEIPGFYEKLEEFKGYKTFTQNFSDVAPSSPIVAANLIFLKVSINNMLGVL